MKQHDLEVAQGLPDYDGPDRCADCIYRTECETKSGTIDVCTMDMTHLFEVDRDANCEDYWGQ